MSKRIEKREVGLLELAGLETEKDADMAARLPKGAMNVGRLSWNQLYDQIGEQSDSEDGREQPA